MICLYTCAYTLYHLGAFCRGLAVLLGAESRPRTCPRPSSCHGVMSNVENPCWLMIGGLSDYSSRDLTIIFGRLVTKNDDSHS